MWAEKENFLILLRLEMRDLAQDVKQLINQCEQEHSRGHYSANIFMQNLATFQNELLALNSFERILDHINPEDFNSLEEMIGDIRRRFHDLVDKHGLVSAIKIYIDRKLNKVAAYFARAMA